MDRLAAGPPRSGAGVDRYYARYRARWIDLFSAAYLGISAAGGLIAVVTLALYVPMSLGRFALIAGLDELALMLALGLGTRRFLSEAEPVRRWLRRPAATDGAADAWRTAVDLPRRGVAIALPRAILLTAIPITALLALEFSFPPATVALIFVGLLAAAIYPAVLFYFALEIYLSPVLQDAATWLPADFELPAAGVSLRRKVLVSLPLINVITGGFVGVLATLITGGSLTDLGLYVVFSLVIAATLSLVLTTLVASALLKPVDDLLTATHKIAAGDLRTRAAVLSADELGRLAGSFNTMTSELVESRKRLLDAREEERRRMRRDLHDGLGPTLGAVILQLDTARRLIATDPAAAEGLLWRLRADTQQAIEDIRRLVYALRPPALDDLGLVGAIRERAETFAAGRDGRPGIALRIDTPEAMPTLPASVEVAAFRIVQEALANVARHSGADRCRVKLSCNGRVELEVADDGCGIPQGRPAGVGLSSMRERAAEVGGRCVVTSSPGLGTRVLAWLPAE